MTECLVVGTVSADGLVREEWTATLLPTWQLRVTGYHLARRPTTRHGWVVERRWSWYASHHSRLGVGVIAAEEVPMAGVVQRLLARMVTEVVVAFIPKAATIPTP